VSSIGHLIVCLQIHSAPPPKNVPKRPPIGMPASDKTLAVLNVLMFEVDLIIYRYIPYLLIMIVLIIITNTRTILKCLRLFFAFVPLGGHDFIYC